MYFFDRNNGKPDKNGLPDVPSVIKLLETKWSATQFLYQEGILSIPNVCVKCGSGVGFKRDPYLTQAKFDQNSCDKDVDAFKHCFIYRCFDRKCSTERSIFKDTFFEHKKKTGKSNPYGPSFMVGRGKYANFETLNGLGRKNCTLVLCRISRNGVSLH